MQMTGMAPTEPVLCAISPQELFQSQVLANIQLVRKLGNGAEKNGERTTRTTRV